ncbi:MAG: 2Fe-2S iron-sulfur cluster binding domain-containing protein [Flavobacteriales bacterium]|nr:2Fe-2S iron-sulfur cluster binding domain-containing protein [Flavobacteriales bacterium]
MSEYFEGEVTIIVDGVEEKVEVANGQSILEAALENSLNVPFSCQAGNCTTCKSKLVSGKISMDNDVMLNDDDIAENYVLTCQSHPLTDDVKIEFE